MSSNPGAQAGRDLVFDLRPVAQRELVAGKYRLLASLGRGGMAEVFLGAATGPAGFNKLVVVKRLRDGCAEDPSFVTMFLDEARLAARLNHPNIVHTYEVDQADDGYIIVMEYLEGQSFRRFSRALREREHFCDPAFAAQLMSEALHGLHYVHEMRDYDGTPLGIVHRDVSPHNLFITYDGQVKVLDFGVAKAKLNVTDTQDGVLKGKFAYMAPEQPTSGEVDRRADIFAAGVVLWELLTGERLFQGDTAATLYQLVNEPIRPPSSVSPAVPPELDAIVLRALERAPDARFPTALEMANALSDFNIHNGWVVRGEEVASSMQELFGEVRETMARKVQAYMASRPRDMPSMESIPSSRSQPHPAWGPQTPTPAPGSLRAPMLEQPRRWLPYLTSGIAVCALVVAGVVLFRHGAPPATAVAARESAPPLARSDADPSYHLTLSSDPPEAQVDWGGKVVGQTPMLIDLLAGSQTFVLSRAGYFNATVVVNVTEGMTGRNESRTVVMVPRSKTAHGGDAAGRPSSVPKSALRADPRVAAAESAENNAPPAAAALLAFAPPPAPPTEGTPAPGPALAAAPSPPATPQPAAGAPAPTGPTVLSFGPEMSRPVLLSGRDLVYTREAMLTGVSGTMIAKCTITTEGTLQNCRLIKGLPHLDKAMLDSLATRRYTPVMYQGKPVSVEYVFNLRVAPASSP